MINIKNLTKVYGDNWALDNLSLTIEEGEVFGLLGHNGAGKSTLIKSIVSVIEPDSGSIIIDGLDLKEHRDEIKHRIGYVADSPDLFLKLQAREYWDFIAQIFKIEKDTKDEKIEELTTALELDIDTQRIEELSHGMRQKVFIIGALLTNPDIWILDEPMTGLDPQSSYNLRQMMIEHKNRGNTVLFSTHVLQIAQEVCDRICILRQGRLIFLGTMEELIDKFPDKDLETIYLEMIKAYDEV